MLYLINRGGQTDSAFHKPSLCNTGTPQEKIILHRNPGNAETTLRRTQHQVVNLASYLLVGTSCYIQFPKHGKIRSAMTGKGAPYCFASLLYLLVAIRKWNELSEAFCSQRVRSIILDVCLTLGSITGTSSTRADSRPKLIFASEKLQQKTSRRAQCKVSGLMQGKAGVDSFEQALFGVANAGLQSVVAVINQHEI